jgi:hypothetical protein
MRRAIYDRITLTAKREGTSRSAIVERAIANALEPTGENVPCCHERPQVWP